MHRQSFFVKANTRYLLLVHSGLTPSDLGHLKYMVHNLGTEAAKPLTQQVIVSENGCFTSLSETFGNNKSDSDSQ